MIKQYALLKLLLAGYLLYLAVPMMGRVTLNVANVFWLSWLLFFCLVVGANLAILMNLQKHSNIQNVESRKSQRSL